MAKAKNVDNAYLVQQSIHSIKYKIRPSATLLNYMQTIGGLVASTADFIYDGLTSTNSDLKQLTGFIKNGDATQMGANLSQFFIRPTCDLNMQATTKAYIQSNGQITGEISKSTNKKKIGKIPATRAVKLPAYKLHLAGILPLPSLASVASDNEIAKQILCAAFAAISGWHECNTLTKANYDEFKAKVDAMCATINGNLTQRQLFSKFVNWLTHCESMQYFRLNERVPHNINKNTSMFCRAEVLSALVNMFPEYNQRFKDDSQLAYFCKIELQKRRLYGHKDQAGNWLQLPLKQAAQWTTPTADKLNLWFQNTLPSFSLAWTDKLPQISLNINGQMQQLFICPGKHGYGNSIIRNVSVKPAGKDTPGKHFVTYERYGKTITGECNSLCVHQKDGNYYVQLPIRFDNASASSPYNAMVAKKPDFTAINEQLKHQRSSIVTSEVQSKELRIVAIDLGVRTPISYVVMHRDANNKITKIADGDLNGKVKDSTVNLIKETKALVSDLKFKINQAVFTLRLAQQPVTINKALFQPFADEIKRNLGRLAASQSFMGQPCGAWFEYAALLRDARSVLIKLSTLGSPMVIPGVNKPVLFPTLVNRLANFKRNLLKKLASDTAKLARSNDVHMVVFEKLDEFTTSGSRDADQNNLLALWSHRTLVDTIRRALMVHGIGFDTVDQRHTSQLDPRNQEFAYRGKRDRSALYVDRNGIIETIDCDKAAAENIGHRYLSRHADLIWIKTVLSDGALVPIGANDDELGVRARGAIFTATNCEYGKFVIKGDNDYYSLVGISKIEYNKLLKRADSNETHELYRHNGGYVLKEEHHQLQNDIGKRAGVYDSDQAFSSAMYAKRFAKRASLVGVITSQAQRVA